MIGFSYRLPGMDTNPPSDGPLWWETGVALTQKSRLLRAHYCPPEERHNFSKAVVCGRVGTH